MQGGNISGNRGNVWDKIATDWAGKEDWMSERKNKVHLQIIPNSSHFTFDSVKLSTVHRKEKGAGKENKINEKTPREPGTRGHHHPHA